MSRNEPDSQVRLTRLYLAGREENIGALIDGLRDPDYRHFAARKLARLGRREAIPALAPLLSAADSNTRIAAVRALGDLSAEEFTPRLLEIAESDSESLVRCWAIAALGQMRDPQVLPYLTETLGDGDRDIRKAAALALGELGDHRALADLRKAKRREAVRHRAPYRRALRRLKNR
jgi:HEAT repeat protein